MVDAFERMQNKTEFWPNSDTIALGLNVPGPLGGYLILDILSESNGIAIKIPESSLQIETEDFRQRTGIDSSPEAGVVWFSYKKLLECEWILSNEKVVLFATGIERR